MNVRLIFNYIGHILRYEGLFMLPAVIIALIMAEYASAIAFAVTIAVCLGAGFLLVGIKQKRTDFYAREGFITVALSWVVLSLVGCLPMVFSGAIPSFTDAFFETVSGFTTTGATLLTDVEALPMSVLYWRSFTHWLGGMGVLVFLLAVMPLAKGIGNSFHILRAESPGPSVGKLVPKITQTAQILYAIYIVMTIIETVMLLAGGMPFFDSITTAFGTAGTGGFSIKNIGIAAYESDYLQTTIAVFMMLFGVNFYIYHLVLLRELGRAFRDEELHLYLAIIVVATVGISVNIMSLYDSFAEALHHGFFQVVSVMTTTGFATADFALWPDFSQVMLLLLMIIGACAGSTGGGVKVSRVLIMLKSTRNRIKKMLHPHGVGLVKMNDRVVDDDTVTGVYVYFSVYAIITVVSVILISLNGKTFETTFSSVLACLNNIGPGLGEVGPMGNYSAFSVFSKYVLSFDMLFGRLELFPMLLLFSPSVWKRSK